MNIPKSYFYQETKGVVGCLKYKGLKKSLKDMEAAIRKGALKRK